MLGLSLARASQPSHYPAGAVAPAGCRTGGDPPCLRRLGEPIDRLAQNAGRHAGVTMRPGTRRWCACGSWPTRPSSRLAVRKEASQAAGGAKDAHQHATSPRVRAALAKRRELAAHARAIKVHERAAKLQERLGHPDQAARAHAKHARGAARSSTRRLADVARDVTAGQPVPTNPRKLAKGRAEQAKNGETTT